MPDHGKRHPSEMGSAEVTALLTHLPVEGVAVGVPVVAAHDRTSGGAVRRHHAHEAAVSRSITAAVRAAGLTGRATSHCFRHSLAAHLLEDGYDIRTVQELLGHEGVSTTMIDTHLPNQGTGGVRNRLDRLGGVRGG